MTLNILNGSWISHKPSYVLQAKESPLFCPTDLVSWDQRRDLGQDVWSEQTGGTEAGPSYKPVIVWRAFESCHCDLFSFMLRTHFPALNRPLFGGKSIPRNIEKLREEAMQIKISYSQGHLLAITESLVPFPKTGLFPESPQ